MHKYAWICDACGLDEHTPMTRADPPAGWRVVSIYREEDDAEPIEHHYCSPRCELIGDMPPDIREGHRRERELEHARELLLIEERRQREGDDDADPSPPV